MAQRSVYHGKPTLVLNPGAGRLFSFGVERAHMILENIIDIIDFVEELGDASVVEQFLDTIDKTYFEEEFEGFEDPRA